MRNCVLCKKKEVKGVSFYKPPKDSGKRVRWSNICRKELKACHYLCSDHFDPKSVAIVGSKSYLLPCAEPVYKLPPSSNTMETKRQNNQDSQKEDLNSPSSRQNNQDSQKEDLNSSSSRNILVKNQNREIKQELSDSDSNCMPPQLEEPIVPILPSIKSVSCSRFAQTNMRICGLVEASDFADEFRFNCFYCSQVFPLEKWKNFVKHLKESHSKVEEAFKTSKYLSKEHDYTPISLPPPAKAKTALEVTVYKTEPVVPVVDPLETSHNPFESVVFNSDFYYTPDKNKLRNLVSSPTKEEETSFLTHPFQEDPKNTNWNKENVKRKVIPSSRFHSKFSKQQSSKRTPLSRCLKRTIEEHIVSEEEEVYETESISIEQIPTEVAFEYTPRPIVDLLLDNMKKFPVLWQFDEQPFNQDFFEAVEDLCKIINNKWSLNIDNLKMRRSINRILRFYCYLFPNENNDQFTSYYDKCASFLPSVNEIAYARCSHCYACYRHDFDLQSHLTEEQKYLEWPYKCTQCKECFRVWEEFEFHKRLPHYDEIFRCQPCKQSFFRRVTYKNHMVEQHQKQSEPGRYVCNICDKALPTTASLQAHKKIHGERQHKCHLCPQSYFDKSKLTLHLRIHRKEQPDFMCEVCGRGFFRQTALKIHMTKHTGEKVTCNICGLRLRKSSLGRHLRTVHVAKASGPVERLFKGKQICLGRMIKARPRQRVPKKSDDLRTYKCKICQVSFDNYKQVVQHNKELHSDSPKWPCKMCTTEFSHKLNLKSHYRRKHKLHILQVYKLVEENEDLNEVLSLEMEHIEELFENLRNSRNNTENAKKSDIKSPVKTDLLPDEVYFAEENIHSSTIQDEIMKAVDDIETHDTKIDYMDDMFTDFLEEP